MIAPIRVAAWLTAAVLFTSSIAHAQSLSPSDASSPPANANDNETELDTSLLAAGATEWMATLGAGYSVEMFHSVRGHQYVTQTLSWGRVLTGPTFRGILRGRFEWAVEVTPMYGQFQPDRVLGIGVSPLSWRWNFEPRGRYAPFVQLSAGWMKSSHPVPQGTMSTNFTANGGAGVRVLVARQQSLVLSYRFDHISNGNRIVENPGINAHAVHVGWSLLKPRK